MTADTQTTQLSEQAINASKEIRAIFTLEGCPCEVLPSVEGLALAIDRATGLPTLLALNKRLSAMLRMFAPDGDGLVKLAEIETAALAETETP